MLLSGNQVSTRLEVEAENPQEPKDGGGAIKEGEPVDVWCLSFVKEECEYWLKIFQEAIFILFFL